MESGNQNPPVTLGMSKDTGVAKKRLLLLGVARRFVRETDTKSPEPDPVTHSAAVWLCDLEPA